MSCEVGGHCVGLGADKSGISQLGAVRGSEVNNEDDTIILFVSLSLLPPTTHQLR